MTGRIPSNERCRWTIVLTVLMRGGLLRECGMSLGEYQLELTRPAWLAVMLVLPLLVYYFYRSLVDLPRRQMLVSLVVRTIVLLLLALSLAGLNLLSPTRQLFVVFAVDESLSVDGAARVKAEEFLAKSTEGMDANQYTVVPFAAEPFSGEPKATAPTAENTTDSADATDQRRGTNIQAVLETAAPACRRITCRGSCCFPTGTDRRRCARTR